jgi:hypothetical protein
MRSNFLLGELAITDAAKAALKRTPLDLIARHAINDHGLATPRQHKSNLKGYKEANEIVSIYHADPTDHTKGRVVITTCPRWTKTTVSMEGE